MRGLRTAGLLPIAVLLTGWMASTVMAANIAGTVFEDPNYGGGAGRTQAASAGIGVVGARVELFNGAGNYAGFVNTGAGGAYVFAGLPAGLYTVRVVNNSVPSTRPGYVGGLLPVQTYRTDATPGVAVPVFDRVGGEVPSKVDAGNGATTLAALTTPTTTAQSITPVTLAGPNIGGVDFGFNFNTIVNVNNSGQGSLRQFLTNSSTLTNAGLAIVGQTAGKDVSIFMISDGAVHPGLRAGLANLLSGSGVAVITPSTILPAISDPDTTLDGTTQTANVGNTNGVTLGVGGKVGVDQLDLSKVPGPEVQIVGSGTILNGIRIAADDVTIRGLSVLGFDQTSTGDGGIHVSSTASRALIELNVIGSAANAFADPTAGFRNYENVYSDGGDDGTIRNNLIGFGDVRGILLAGGSTGWTIEDNEIRDCALGNAGGDGIALDPATADVTGNLVTGSGSQGIVVKASGSTFTNNTVKNNGIGTVSASGAAAGMTFRTGSTNHTVDRNEFITNFAAGLSVNDGASGIKITRNSFSDNGTIVSRKIPPESMTGQIGIDLNKSGDNTNQGTSPFRTKNDIGDADSGGNDLLNFPILVSAVGMGGNLKLEGFALANSVIEVFVADPDPLEFGEGITYKITLTEDGTGAGAGSGDDPYADDDDGIDDYTDPINGINQGSDNDVDKFSFTFPLPSGVGIGTQLTATATLGGQTSEFSGLVTVGGQISGTVYEDVNGDALLGDGSARSGVTVHLYLDDGDDTPDGGDAFVVSTVTDGSGGYTFPVAVNTTYWIVIDSTTVSPSAGLNAPFTATHTWAEQTHGPTGAWCADGAGGDTERVSAGPCYAGRLAGTSDAAGALTTAQHIARIPVVTSPVGGIDFGFSFKVISNTSAATQVTANTRSTQGSFDQALANANALIGGDALRFVPALAPDDGSGNWWKIDYTSATAPLESIFDTGTVVDGTAYCAWSDGTQGCGATTTVRDTNTAGTGQNVTVGINDTFTTPALDPELEIVNEGLRVSQATAGLVPHGLEVRNVSVRGDTILIDVLAGAASLTAMIIEDNVLGSPPDSFLQPVTLPEYGVRVSSATSCQIRDNLIGFAQRSTLNLGTATGGCVVTRNEIRGSGKVFKSYDAVLLWALPSTIEGNLITDSESPGIDTVSSGGGHTLTDNTITLCGQGGEQTMGIRLVGTGSTVERNVIQDNTGPGILATGSTPLSIQHRISDNEFGGNGGPAIDLVNAVGDDNTGDGITLNDGTQLGTGTAGNACGTIATSGNVGLDFPIIDTVLLDGSVSGRACAGSEVEIYRATAGAGDSAGGTDHGEGVALLGTTTANGSGDFSLSVGALTSSDELTAIAIDGSNNTSEFSANAMVQVPKLVKRAFQLDGTPIASGSTLPTGMPVRFLLYIDNSGSVLSDVRIQDALDPLFAYQVGSIQVDNSYTCVGDPCNAADEAAILAAVLAVTADCHGSGSTCTDASDGDVVRYSAPTVFAGGAGNAQLDIAAGKVWAVVFTVRIQ